MSDDLSSLRFPESNPRLLEVPDRGLHAPSETVGSWLATRWRQILLGIAILEIVFQVDAYFHRDAADAQFGAISGFNFSLTTMCIFLLYAQWLPRLVVESRPIKISKSLIAYCLLVASSILWASDKGRTLFELFLLLQALMIFTYVINFVKTNRGVMFVMILLLIGLNIQALFMVATKLVSNEISVGPITFWFIDDSHRVAGSFGSPNVASGYLALLIVPCFSLLFVKVSPWVKLLALSGTALGGLALVFTLSRGGWLAAGISMAIFCLIAFRKRWLSAPIFTMLVLAVAMVAIGFHQVLLDRLLGDDGGSAASRVPLAQISGQLIASHPMGVGANNWDLAAMDHAKSDDFREEWFYMVHNKYLLVLTETGWLGLSAFLCFLLSVATCAWRGLRLPEHPLSPLLLGLFAAFTGQSIHMAFDIFNSRAQIQMLFLVASVIISLAAMIERDADEHAGPARRPSDDGQLVAVTP